MVGSGSDGIKVVNGSVLKKEFELLQNINEKEKYLKKVSKRGEAANSDHYPFYRKKVPAFFIYTLGDEYKEYHTPVEKAEKVPMTEYDDLFRLMLAFVNALCLSN